MVGSTLIWQVYETIISYSRVTRPPLVRIDQNTTVCWNMQRSFDWSGHPFWEIRDTALTSYVGTMQRSFDWSGHPSWEIRGTALTYYVGTCKSHLTDQDIPSEKSEALDSPSMLEHAKVVERSGHPSWEIRGTGLTSYVGTCKGHLTNQDIPPEKSEALHSHTMLEHAKVIWLIRTSLLRNQRHCTHSLCWNMQRPFDWSGHSSWEIRGTALTTYVDTCKVDWIDIEWLTVI